MKIHPVTRAALRVSMALLVACALPEQVGAAEPATPQGGKGEKAKEKQPPRYERLPPKLKPVPKIDLAARPAMTAEEKEKIAGLIKKFAEIDKPDFGMSSTMAGSAFAPQAGAGEAGMMMLTDHKLETSPAFTEIVRIGPRALPALLEALDDETPTKLVMEHKGGFGAMWYAREVSWNSASPEQEKIGRALRGEEDKRAFRSEHIDKHPITIGDVCFVALGQITGAGYAAVRYQPTACVVINSTSHDAELAKAVRALNPMSQNPERALLDHLLTDYFTEGTFNGESLDGWYSGSSLQIAAVRRLLFYFPKETVELVAERLKKFEVMVPKADPDNIGWMKREVANGARTEDFVKAVAWCPEPPIRTALTEIFRRTDDPGLLVAAAPALGKENAALLRERITARLAKLTKEGEEDGPYGDAFQLLVLLGGQLGEEAKGTFQSFAKKAGLMRKTTFVLVCDKLRAEWTVELLQPLLRDKQEFGYGRYAPDPAEPKKLVALRLCDAAAKIISTVRPALKFELTGPRKNLDEQIKKMQYDLLPEDGEKLKK